jgi:hypothetical protein
MIAREFFGDLAPCRSDLSITDFLVRLQNHFPGPVRVVFLLKPEGVLQRALEVGYRTIADSCQFKASLSSSCPTAFHRSVPILVSGPVMQ